jgi:hypothetical protein
MSRKRLISGIEDDALVTVGIVAAGYFLVVKPILSTLGLDDNSKQTLSAVDATQPDENPFSWQYQPYQDFYNNEWANPGLTEQQNWQQVKAIAQSNPGALDAVTNAVYTWGETINNAFGFFLGYVDEDNVVAVFNQIPSKVMVSAVSDYIYSNYQQDLWSLIKNGHWYNLAGLHPQGLVTIVTRVNSLPVS